MGGRERDGERMKKGERERERKKNEEREMEGESCRKRDGERGRQRRTEIGEGVSGTRDGERKTDERDRGARER